MNKKIMMLGIFMLALGVNVYARHGYGSGSYGSNGRYTYCNGQGYNRDEHFSGRGYGMHSTHNFWSTSEGEKIAIFIEEKNLEIRKELLKDAPDWEKIEKMNIEIASEKAKAKTKYMQSRYKELQKN